MRYLISLISTVATALLCGSAAGDTLPVLGRMGIDLQPLRALPSGFAENPALMWFSRDFSITDLSLGYEREKRGEASLLQTGNGYQGVGFSARSFIRLDDRQVAFGKAGYRNGKKKQVVWNETADFQWIYPYVAGDSVGGDLQTEIYYFSGGYAWSNGTWTVGVNADYRAQLESRKVDPRPRTVVSDLDAALAAARKIGDRYVLSLAGYGRFYHQYSEMKYFYDMTSPPLYHLTGLGMDYVRFTGSALKSTYRGFGGGSSVSILPVDLYGFSASVKYNYFGFTKELTQYNNLPLLEMKDHTVSAVVAYRGNGNSLDYGVELSGQYQKRTGTENIFNEVSNVSYDKISSSGTYFNSVYSARLQADLGSTLASGLTWWVTPSGSFYRFESEYPSEGRRMDFSRWTAGFGATVQIQADRWLWSVSASAGYSGGIAGALNLEGTDGRLSLPHSYETNYRYLTDSYTNVGAGFRVARVLSRDIALFLETDYKVGFFRECGTTTRWNISVGLTF